MQHVKSFIGAGRGWHKGGPHPSKMDNSVVENDFISEDSIYCNNLTKNNLKFNCYIEISSKNLQMFSQFPNHLCCSSKCAKV